MKNFIKYFIILTAGFYFTACEIEDPIEDNIGKGEHISEFTLAAPANNATIQLNPGAPANMVKIMWNTASTGLGGDVHYTFMLDEVNGDFSDPLLSLPSDNEGMSNYINIPMSDLLDVVGAGGDFIWTVEANNIHELGNNNRSASLPYSISFSVPQTGITPFEYIGPTPNQKIFLDKIRTPNSTMVIDWEAASATDASDVTYKVVFSTTENGFDSPVLEFDSDNNGSDTQLTFTHAQIIEILDGVEYEDGLFWRVEATAGDLEFSPETRFMWFEIFDIPTLYALGSATTADWNNNETDPIPFTKNGEGLFSVVLPLTGGNEVKFVMIAGSWDVNWGMVNGGDPIVPGTEYELLSGGPNIKIPETATYKISVDFLNGTFTIDKFELYLVGGSSSADWNPSNAVQFRPLPGSSTQFELYEYLTVSGDGVKFLPQKGDWAGDYGMAPGNPGSFVQEGEENIKVTEDGFYRILVDFADNTYSVTKIHWGLIGSATPDGWNSDTDMTHSGMKGDYTWTMDVTLTNGEIKFRANDDWAINFGDSGGDGSVEYGGDNIGVTAGTYTISLILDPVNGYSYTIQ